MTISQFVAGRIAAGDMPGAAWHVEAGGRVLSAGAIGNAAVAPAPLPATTDTAWDLASLTKPLSTALLAVLLESEGKLDLGGRASLWLPELEGSRFEEATLLDLGAHRAGLPAWKPVYLRASSPEGYAAAIAREAPAVPPGTTLYSDLGFILLGIAVERAAVEDLASLFSRRIAGPLGLRRTGFGRSGRPFPGAAATETAPLLERRMAGSEGEGFAWREAIRPGEVHDGNAWGLGGAAGHAGLFGTAAEVGGIARAVAEASLPGLAAVAARRLLQPVAGEGSRPLGFTLARLSDAARGILPDLAPGHNGFTGTALWLDPTRSAIYVLLANRVHPRAGERDFQPVRREFLRIASALAAGATR